MEHEFYRGSARRAEVGMRRRVQAVLGDDMPVRWSRTTIDLRHQLKGSKAAVWCLRVLDRAGVRRQVLDFLAPVLFHVEALVYRGDFEYEDAQRDGGTADPQWREGIEEILRAYEIDEPAILGALAELDDYFLLESSIMEGRAVLDADLIQRTCYSRCSGATLLLRIGYRLAGIRPDERLFTLVRHLSGHDEISTDLPSYAEDLQEGLFNVYRLSTWIYGPEAAKHHLKRQGDDMLRALRHDITHTDAATLRLFAAIIPPIVPLNPRVPSVVPRLLPRALLAELLKLRIRFHSVAKAPRFPAPLADSRPIASAA
ncbi:hypothetical protein [Lentzea sp. NEAU-D7]|uniref:hypothetical protein n=1 Tax=Lentzea sp. NEAU-D7 TaxID=2994667 RepID=UPI00224AD25C|nr:hypothetical protein [Lentzea sp. NEAU-D7]MCX2951524.1 hypothetical protein [Lentzea sp. NEAU-D7]